MACEHVSMAEGEWLANLCTAKGTMAGGEVPCLTMAVANGSMAEEGWLAVAGKLGALDPFGAPQSKAAAAATDEMLHKAKAPSSAAMVSATEADKPSSMAGRKNVKYRLSKSYIRSIIALRLQPPRTIDDLESIADLFPPGWIEEKRRRHEETKEMYRQMDEEWREFRQKVIDGVKEKGYFEVDEEFVGDLDESEDYFTLTDDADTRLFPFATPEERKLAAEQGYLLYVPDEDDYLLSDGDDSDDSDGDDEYVSDEDDYPPSDGDDE